MTPKRRASEKCKEKVVSEECNKERFVNLGAKKRFDYPAKINKKFIVKRRIDFGEYEHPKVSNGIATLG